MPLGWAGTQNNLGNALQDLAGVKAALRWLQKAVTAYRAALEERTRDKVPLDWAATQNNLGNALAELGTRESGTALLEDAVAAYRAALEEWTQDKVPLNWAFTQFNLCIVEIAYFDKTGDGAHLDQAQAYVNAAKAVVCAGWRGSL